MDRTLELWVATLGILVAGTVAIGWLAAMPAQASRLDIVMTVAACTMFGWAALVIGGQREGRGAVGLRSGDRIGNRAYGEIEI